MANEGNDSRISRMDLNLYLGLPRSPQPRSLDLGSDLALSSLPLSPSSTTEESRAPVDMSSGAVEPSDSPTPYSPSNASFTPEPTIPGIDPLPRVDGNNNQEYTPFFPSYEPFGGQLNDPIPVVRPLPTLREIDEEVSLPELSDMPLLRGYESHVPPVDFLGRNDSTSSWQDLLESPEIRFRRLIDSNHRWRLRRCRSSLPYPTGGERSNFGPRTSPGPEQLRVDIMSSQRCLETNGKHKVLAEGIAAEGSEEEKEEKNKTAVNFECNICLELAKEPVVTSCGHLFCWRCLYEWLYVHSEHKECPVCKGEVTESNITPIYGRGSAESNEGKKLEDNGDSALKIPPRPRGNRLESLRQQFRPISRRFGEGMATSWRRLVNQQMRTRTRFDGHGDASVPGLVSGGNHTVLTRLRARRMMREELNSEMATDAEETRMPRDSMTNPSSGDASLLFREGIDLWHQFSVYGLPPTDRLAAITADIGRVVGSGNRYGASTSSVNPLGPEQLIPRSNMAASAADQASASSTTAVIQGDVRPDSLAELNSAGSSRSHRRRGRNNASGSLDVDGGVLHARKRRRLN